MKKLIVVRHGHAPGSELTDEGKQMVHALAEKLKAVVNGGPFTIVTSDYRRAIQSGAILAEVLGLPGTPAVNERVFCGEFPSLELLEDIDALGAQHDVVIIVSHDVSVQSITRDYAEYVDIPCDKPPKMIPEASGFVVDHETKKVRPIYSN